MSIPKTYARKSNLSIILLREILSKTFCDLNYEAILSPVFVWIIAFVSAAFLIVAYGMAPSLVKVGRELVSETSPWSGVRRIDQGFFIDPKRVFRENDGFFAHFRQTHAVARASGR
jgi:hypothetical protein